MAKSCWRQELNRIGGILSCHRPVCKQFLERNLHGCGNHILEQEQRAQRNANDAGERVSVTLKQRTHPHD